MPSHNYYKEKFYYGVITVKVFKKDNKYLIYLPYDVVQQLHITPEDEVDFFKFSEEAFLFAKKADVVSLLSKGTQQKSAIKISNEELEVLKKLDTYRYPNRTVQNIDKILSEDEKKVLQRLIDRKLVVPFNDEKRKEKLYSISKYVYDNFLMRKKPGQSTVGKAEIDQARAWGEVEPPVVKGEIKNKDAETLEKNGYVVVATEPEAAALSIAIGESIRQGKVIGIRGFNKKYYIMLRSFFDENSPKVISALKTGPKSVSELAASTKMDPDALRCILYFMAESGDVTENRRDVFALVS